MNNDFLTPDGQQRRRQILQRALREARRRRRQRWVAPGAGGALVLLIAGFIALRPRPHLVAPTFPPTVARITAPIAPPVPPAPPSTAVVEYIATDPTITDRLSIPQEPPRWTSIDDQQLLAELASAGQPAGLAYINGRAILLWRGPRR